MTTARNFLSSIGSVGITIAFAFARAPAWCQQSTNCSTPPNISTSAGSAHWTRGGSATVYIDPTFSPAEQADIQAAANGWVTAGAFSSVNFTTTDPGPSAGNGNIRITQDTQGPDLADTTPNYTSNQSSTIVGADITFNRTKTNPDGSLAYSAGSINGGDVFMTNTMEHELGHALGLDDFRDSTGKVIDSPMPSVMGAYSGTNNQGIPPAPPLSGTQAGNESPITQCDQNAVKLNQIPPGAGRSRTTLLYEDPNASSDGAGGEEWDDEEQTYDLYEYFS